MSEKITAESILGLARGFMASRVLLSGAELDLFTLLSKEPLTMFFAFSGPHVQSSPAGLVISTLTGDSGTFIRRLVKLQPKVATPKWAI